MKAAAHLPRIIRLSLQASAAGSSSSLFPQCAKGGNRGFEAVELAWRRDCVQWPCDDPMDRDHNLSARPLEQMNETPRHKLSPQWDRV